MHDKNMNKSAIQNGKIDRIVQPKSVNRTM